MSKEAMGIPRCEDKCHSGQGELVGAEERDGGRGFLTGMLLAAGGLGLGRAPRGPSWHTAEAPAPPTGSPL